MDLLEQSSNQTKKLVNGVNKSIRRSQRIKNLPNKIIPDDSSSSEECSDSEDSSCTLSSSSTVSLSDYETE